jgi:hypothetical protein
VLKGRIGYDGEGTMALRYPEGDEVAKLGFVICRSMGEVVDALASRRKLSGALLNMAVEIRSGAIMSNTCNWI